jgi:hypothetical protein
VRHYDVAIAALAIDAPPKWIDNVLSQHAVPDVVSARRGVSRRLSHSALLRLALVRELHVELRLGVRDALELAAELLDTRDASVHARGHLRVAFDRSALERDLAARLGDALESAPIPRRGRPPRRAPRAGSA